MSYHPKFGAPPTYSGTTRHETGQFEHLRRHFWPIIGSAAIFWGMVGLFRYPAELNSHEWLSFAVGYSLAHLISAFGLAGLTWSIAAFFRSGMDIRDAVLVFLAIVTGMSLGFA